MYSVQLLVARGQKREMSFVNLLMEKRATNVLLLINQIKSLLAPLNLAQQWYVTSFFLIAILSLYRLTNSPCYRLMLHQLNILLTHHTKTFLRRIMKLMTTSISVLDTIGRLNHTRRLAISFC